MTLKISKTNATPYEYYSTGDGSLPITAVSTLTGIGGTISASTIDPTFLVAVNDTTNIGSYSNIAITPINQQTGINWELSLDNVNWSTSITVSTMSCKSADDVVQIYVRSQVANDGSVLTGNYSVPDIQISATENP